MPEHSKVVDLSVVDETAVADGRRMRSERSRDAIIEAALQLVQEGILVPRPNRSQIELAWLCARSSVISKAWSLWLLQLMSTLEILMNLCSR